MALNFLNWNPNNISLSDVEQHTRKADKFSLFLTIAKGWTSSTPKFESLFTCLWRKHPLSLSIYNVIREIFFSYYGWKGIKFLFSKTLTLISKDLWGSYPRLFLYLDLMWDDKNYQLFFVIFLMISLFSLCWLVLQSLGSFFWMVVFVSFV